MLRKISECLGNTLAKELHKGEEQAEVLIYGLEIIFGSVIKVSTILICSYVLGVLSTTLVATITFIVYRLLSGGVHLKNYFPCLIFGTFILLLIGKVANMIALANYLQTFVLVIGLITFVISLRLAPAENPNRKLNDKEKEKFKLLSGMFVISWICFSYVSIPITGGAFNNLILASALALLAQGLTLTPQAYKIVGDLEMLIRGGENYAKKNAL